MADSSNNQTGEQRASSSKGDGDMMPPSSILSPSETVSPSAAEDGNASPIKMPLLPHEKLLPVPSDDEGDTSPVDMPLLPQEILSKLAEDEKNKNPPAGGILSTHENHSGPVSDNDGNTSPIKMPLLPHEKLSPSSGDGSDNSPIEMPLLPHEKLSSPTSQVPTSPASVTPISSTPAAKDHPQILIYQSSDAKVYLDGDRAIKEHISFAHLREEFHATDELYHSMRVWYTVLPQRLGEILGADHPYLNRLSGCYPIVPIQFTLVKRNANHTDTIDGVPVEGEIKMRRMVPVRPGIISDVIYHTFPTAALRAEARQLPANFDLHPLAYLGMNQPASVAEQRSQNTNLAAFPAYLEQITQYVGRKGVIMLARQMGIALAVIHVDLARDAHHVKFHVGYEEGYDRATLWISGLGRMNRLDVKDDGEVVGDPALEV
ncbi:uncharacterized protein CTRU02_210618 [Colletotrichum truncatum]|uniref:Uncharacterized protein n=1 Tax=Colletotrichum truncatum TaxID=5467 RepID=A0ACC3YPI1_COLTU|nr:uncharacterized protein CTRU02_03888 [Colletotrichum truncatum]KAF6796910.1 hypothetical protein CTRU02_03888 [Colletotrichum truncatum]